jgi:hypothetical protein
MGPSAIGVSFMGRWPALPYAPSFLASTSLTTAGLACPFISRIT